VFKVRLKNGFQAFRNTLYRLSENGLLNELKNVRQKRVNGAFSNSLQWRNFPSLNDSYHDTSLTDSIAFENYSSFCAEAATDDSIFQNFRSYPIYREVLEHVPHQLGIFFANELSKKCDLSKIKNSVKKIDKTGSPWTYFYRDIGKCSPTSLRYLFFALQIKDLLGGTKIETVCEIGGGFGGQMVALAEVIDFESAKFVDLKPSLLLTSKYLNSDSRKFASTYNSPEDENTASFDLLVSNYAFSELRREFQDAYLEKYVNRSNAGFILWNPLSFESLDGYDLSQIVKKIPGAKCIPEEPSSYPGNHLIYWRRAS